MAKQAAEESEALAVSLGTHLCISMLALMNFRSFLLLLLSITLLFTIQIDMPVSVDEPRTFLRSSFLFLDKHFPRCNNKPTKLGDAFHYIIYYWLCFLCV